MKRKKLEEVQALSLTDTNIQTSKDLEYKINELLKREQIMWKQRVRIEWLHLGDRNTSFFHGKASNKERRNYIDRIQNEKSNWVKDEDEIESIIMGVF